MVRFPDARGAPIAKGLRCQSHASRIDRSSILVGIKGSLGHTSCEVSWRFLNHVSKMGSWIEKQSMLEKVYCLCVELPLL